MSYQIIEVHWEDHHEHVDAHTGSGRTIATPALELESLTWKTVGYLISENDHMLEVARDYTDDTETNEPICHPLRIIKKNIVYLKKF